MQQAGVTHLARQATLMPKISNVHSRIVHAAVSLFSRRGYRGTTTREIARLADVSEVTVFRYFGHKEDIFLSALNSSFGVIKPRLDLFDRIPVGEAPEVVLPKILRLLVDTATFSPELVRLIAVSFLEMGGRTEELCREQLTPLFRSISNYLQASIDAGRLRDLDPGITTTAMALTIIAHPEFSKITQGARYSNTNSLKAVDEYAAFWLGTLLRPVRDSSIATVAPPRIANY